MKLLLILGGFACVLVMGAHAQSAGNNVVVVYPPPAPPPQIVIVRTHPVEPVADLESGPELTTYLIAFKDSVVRVARQYWVRGNTLFYLTTEHQQMSAPLSSVDRSLSEQLNSEQNVAFSLPAEQEKAIVQAHVTHHVTIAKHTRCYCVSGVTSMASGAASRARSTARVSK